MVQVMENMEMPPQPLRPARPEVLPGLALSPLTLTVSGGGGNGGDGQNSSVSKELPEENILQPCEADAQEETSAL